MCHECLYQVNEPEQILRNRSLNSSPAAATADRQGDVATEKTPPPSRINTLLERKIQRLEAELEKQNEEAKCCLRTMEQEFHLVKVQTDKLTINMCVSVVKSTDAYLSKSTDIMLKIYFIECDLYKAYIILLFSFGLGCFGVKV